MSKVLLLTNDETDGFSLGDVRKIDGVHYRLTRLADGKNEWTPIIKATKDEIDKYEFGDIKEVGEDSYLFSYNDATKDYEWILEKIDISQAEDSRNNLTWSDLGFDGSYVGDFDINHAKELLAGGYKSQKDAVKYLTFYAKNNVNDAKIVLICDIINKKNEFDPDIWEYANSAFYMIFRAYINKVILAHYARIQSEHINKGQVEDAYSHLWEYVLLNLHEYNPEKGRINTYYSVKILDTELMRFDFRYRANVSVSHPTEMQDIAVARIVRMLEECGEEVTLQNVCARARYDRKLKNCGSAAIESSLERNNFRVMSSIDSEEGQNMMKDRTQETFDNPEHAYMRQEKRGYIISF